MALRFHFAGFQPLQAGLTSGAPLALKKAKQRRKKGE
jgi:hypothetical protein